MSSARSASRILGAPACVLKHLEEFPSPRGQFDVQYRAFLETATQLRPKLHRYCARMLDDPSSRREDDVYRQLAAGWNDIAQLVEKSAVQMTAQHELPMGTHDETAWGEAHLQAFEKFVKAQTQVLALLRVSAERDEKMLASMMKEA